MQQRVLIFQIGSLGDSIVALPAIWAAVEYFAGARFSLLCDNKMQGRFVSSAEVLSGIGVFDELLYYPKTDDTRAGWLPYIGHLVKLLSDLRQRKFDFLVYLPPSRRSPKQIKRDRIFFRVAGIKRLFGMDMCYQFPTRVWGRLPDRVPYESDLLLARLAASGIPIPQAGCGRLDIAPREQDREEVKRWLADLTSDSFRPWIGIGPGCKLEINRWPYQRYQQVGEELIRRFDVWPIIFGGPEDWLTGERMICAWGRGYNAAGKLGVRSGIMAMQRCRMFVGNDTGTMHMAAAAGNRCVALHSSNNLPGKWEPYGKGHTVIRTSDESFEARNESILAIRVDDVIEACSAILTEEMALKDRSITIPTV